MVKVSGKALHRIKGSLHYSDNVSHCDFLRRLREFIAALSASGTGG
jgi:hypothetical protein